MKKSAQQISIGLLSITILVITTFTLTTQISQKRSINTSQAYTEAGFDGIQLYKGYFTKGSAQDTTLSGSIYTGTGAPDIAVGNTVIIGIASVGSGTIDVSDNKNNTYTPLKIQQIDKSASVYVFRSVLTTPLKAYDTISIHSTSAKSMAVSALAFHGVSNILQASGNADISKSPSAASLYASQGNIVVIVSGFRARAGDFSATYAPVVQVISGADSGNSGNSLDNSIVRLDGFVAPSTSTYNVPILISNLKSRTGIPWGTIGVVFN